MLPYSPAIVAEALAQILDAAAAAHGRATLAIPGGRSPGPVLTALAGLLEPFVRDRLHLLWLDERAVPLGHADRNDAPTLAAWDAGGPRPKYVHPMPAESNDLEQAAAHYTEVLNTATAGRNLDACLIGIGEDGHFASLFPNHIGLKEMSPVFVVRDSPKPPAHRLTLSLPCIRSAGFQAILALGAAKGAVAVQAKQSPRSDLPISLLPANRSVWYVDDAAMSAIQST